jgi:hypothetical protein
MRPRWAQGQYSLKNPDKYVGLRTPRYRSSWEQVFMRFCDENPGIVRWASESIKIPYQNPLTGKHTVYVPDFFIQYTNKDGKSLSEVIEVKPKRQTRIKAAEQGVSIKAATLLNHAKWDAASKWCKQKKIKFRVITEDDIFHRPAKR